MADIYYEPSRALASKVLTATPTVSSSPAYSTGDNVGGKVTLTSVARAEQGSGIIQSVVITSKSLQTATFDVVFFSSDPSGSTFTDNSSQGIVDADLSKIVGVAQCTTVVALAAESIHQATGLSIPFALSGGATTLYAAIIVRGTPTLASTSDIWLSVRVLPQ
jgi:hypothetical protein